MKKITLVGAGSSQFGCGTIGDLLCFDSLRNSEICLLDVNPETLKSVEKAATRFVEEHGLPFKITATTEREKALAGADFVIISIETGNRFELWDMDWQIPQQYGVKQVYGENGGPGGLFHSLRVIPPILAICEDVMRHCPEAYVFNYSNPMSRICTTVHRKLPELKLVGLCHEIASLERHLPRILDLPYEEIEFTAGGLNHFSVLLKASRRKTGEDLYPRILAKADEYFRDFPCFTDYLRESLKSGTIVNLEGSREALKVEASRRWGERGVFMEIVRKFGLLPITTDSHFGEYLGWAHDVSDHKAILDFYAYYRMAMGAAEAEIELKVKERVAPIIHALVTGESYVEDAVNIPNRGYVTELPEFIAVEVPATITQGKVEGVPLGILPKAFAGLLTNQIAVHDLTAEAVLLQSKEAVVQALLVDPVVNVCRNLGDMVEAMITKQRPYLDYLH